MPTCKKKNETDESKPTKSKAFQEKKKKSMESLTQCVSMECQNDQVDNVTKKYTVKSYSNSWN